MFNSFFRGKRVLVTGHTGFKGGWLSLWLKHLGAEVLGLSLQPPTVPNIYEIIKAYAFAAEAECDIRSFESLQAAVLQLRPEVVFHLAAQPIVRRSYVEPLETLQTNALGTANLLEAIRQAKLHAIVVVITSDKCYENREWEFSYRENDPLGGHDVYSMSKACTELITQAWKKSFYQLDNGLGPVTTARAGNVIGGGDYGQDRIVPDCVRALQENRAILVRNPTAVRPWQHVLECLSGYLWLAARLGTVPKDSPVCSPFNFGPDPSCRQTVRRLVEELLITWPGHWVDGSDPASPHEAKLLSLTIDKAAALLDWHPSWSFEQGVRQTIAWYHERHVKKTGDMLGFTLSQIEDYAQTASQKELAWTK